jgi:exosome complex component CSL4
MTSVKEKTRVALPGDTLAVSEEFLPGKHAYDSGGLVRALAVGSVLRDTKSMEVSVKPAAKADLVRVGDVVVGQVEAAQASSAGIRIYYINGKQNDKDFSGSLALRSGRPGRGGPRGPPAKLGDVVRCRVFSLVNGIIHLSMNEDDLGVISANCGNCGRPLTRGGNKAKCDECGNVEDRKLAADFGAFPIRP